MSQGASSPIIQNRSLNISLVIHLFGLEPSAPNLYVSVSLCVNGDYNNTPQSDGFVYTELCLAHGNQIIEMLAITNIANVR